MAADTFGIIAPHPPIFMPSVGGAEANQASASLDALALASRALAHFAPETILLMSPHAPAAYDTFLVDDSAHFSGSMSQFGDPDTYEWEGDTELARALVDRLDRADTPVALRDADVRLRPGWLDHATIVPLSFIDAGSRCRLVVLSLSYLPYEMHRRVGEIAAQVVSDLGRRVAFVASGDMSHRLTPGGPNGYSPQGKKLDAAIVDLVTRGSMSELMSLDPQMVEEGGECGLRSFITLGGFAGSDPVPTRVLSYEGPWGVGYLTALVGEAALTSAGTALATPPVGEKGGTPGADESEIVRLARSSIDTFVTEGHVIESAPLQDPRYPAQAGAFVSLHRAGMLRGCIGTIVPTRETLADEVVHNAIEAATMDPRFPAVGADELGDLDVKVDVLHPPESCTLTDLDPANYGVIVTSGWRRGLLLPDLEGVDDVASQVSIAMQKAGIQPTERCDIERFKVDRYT